jgi:hypothetical protein
MKEALIKEGIPEYLENRFMEITRENIREIGKIKGFYLDIWLRITRKDEGVYEIEFFTPGQRRAPFPPLDDETSTLPFLGDSQLLI